MALPRKSKLSDGVLWPVRVYPANSLFIKSVPTLPGKNLNAADQKIAEFGFELDQPAAI